MLRVVILAVVCQLLCFGIFAQEPPREPVESQEKAAEKQEADKEDDLSSYVVVEDQGESLVPSQSASVTKVNAPLQVTPLSVTVVTSELLQAQSAYALGDALRNVSGAVSHTGFGVFDYFTIRGFDSLTTGLVLTDGTPEPESSMYHLYNIERVEVLKGPAAFLYGGNPLVAGVNLVRKSPLFESLTRVGGSFGSFETIQGTLDLNRANADDTVAFRLNAFGRTSNGYRDAKENWQGGVNPAASLRLGEKGLLTLNFEYVRNEYAPDSGLPLFMNAIADVPRTRSYQSPFDSSVQNVSRFKADYSRVLTENAVFRNKFYFTDLDWVSNGTLFPAVFPDYSGGVSVYRTLMRLNDRQRLFGNQAEVVLKFQTAQLKHELLAGFELSRLGDVFTLDLAMLPSIDLYNPVETAQLPLYNIPYLGQAADTRNWVLAPYLIDSIAVSEQLRFLVGGRFDTLDFEDSVSGLERDSRNFSPMAGVAVSVVPELTLYANYGEAFAPPSSQAVGELKPEESRQVELGGKLRLLDGKIVAGLAYFDLERNNIAIPDETGVQKQLGDQSSHGFEIELAGEVGPGLYLLGSYANTQAELDRFTEMIDLSMGQYPPVLVDRSGNIPPFAPEHVLNLSVFKRFHCGMTLGLSGRYLSEQFIAADNGFAIDSWATIDASATYRFDTWQLRLNLKNLTGQEYESRGFGTTSVLPADPFTVSLGIDFIN